MKYFISVGLIVAGIAILAWAAASAWQPPPLPYELHRSRAAPGALPEFSGLDVDTGKLERLDLSAPGRQSPIVTATVTHDREGRLVALSWSNAVAEPVLFPDINAAEASKILTAIKEHVPSEAIILSWWDFSRRIRSIAQRQAPLDDPLARGLLMPSAWEAKKDLVTESQRTLWGAGVPAGDGTVFAKFVDALLSEEQRGVDALAELAGGKPAYIAVHLSDIWKAAAVRPELISIAYRDFPAVSEQHGVIRAVREWIQEQKIEGGYAVEPIGNAIRVHYLPRKAESTLLLTRLLPFSTSNPLDLNRLRLVYQYRGYWIYELRM
jgi:hydroxylamine oxidation protein HaoB